MALSIPNSFVLACCACAACVPAPSPETKFILVTSAYPRNTQGVFLNEPLTFFFSGEIDRASVTSESVSIRSSDDVLARGAIAVNGNSLTFTPVPVRSSDLLDGGYRPDTEYSVQIHGFPWVDGLRGAGGEPLRDTYTYRFKTVSAKPPIETLLFVDTEPDKTRPLGFFPPPASIDAYTIGSDDVIYLDSDKPIDPTSVRDSDFLLTRKGGGGPVPVRARLIENESEARARSKPRGVQSVALETFWESQPRAALLELTPVQKLGTETTWRLTLARDENGSEASGPRDFSGHTLWSPALSLPIRVGLRNRDAGKGVLYEDFVTRDLSRPVAVPGADGLAHWSSTGRVEVRFPAAAGLGTAGAVTLAGAVLESDLHATRLSVTGGERATLAASKGLVVLRAQGTLRIAGQVTREAVFEAKAAEPELKLHTTDDALARSVTLTRWLELVRAQGRTVTVLVAGGDLVIEPGAELITNTPIVLVAGGVVRVLGRVRTRESQGRENPVFVLGDGGGDIAPPRADPNLLEMDGVCEGNPLREVLHYAVLSGPLPQRGSVSAWTSAEAGGWRSEEKETPGEPQKRTENRWSVRYVREVIGSPASIEELGPVDRPQTLEPVGSIQMLIELWVAPGPTFDPPFVDFVRLTWEQKPLSAGPGGPR